jgi:hypothetical protein
MNRAVADLMDDIMVLCKDPKRAEIRKVVVKMIEKYPQLATQIGGSIIGDGTAVLVAKLEARRDNINRPLKRRRSASDSSDPKAKPSKLPQKNTYGCIVEMVNPDLPEGESSTTQEQKADQLRNHYELMEFDKEYVNKLMNDTYPSQRILINSNPPVPVKEILNKYPFLCEEEWLLGHFFRLTGVNLAALTGTVNKKAMKMYTYLKAQRKKTTQVKDELSLVADAITKEKSNQPIVDHLIPTLAAYFKEKATDIIRIYEVTIYRPTMVDFKITNWYL